MEKLLAAIVAAGLIPSAKLDDETAASLFKAEFEKVKKRADDAEKAKTDLQAKLDKAASDAAKLTAETAVDLAVKEGKISKDDNLRARWIAAYLKDEEGTKAMLKGMLATPAKPTRGAPPVIDAPEDGLDDLDSVRAAIATETDPDKKYALGLKARKLRGHEGAFSADK